MRHTVTLTEATTLHEMPLPAEWDGHMFSDPSVPFADRVAYALARVPHLKGGTTRAAFSIPYQGRKTVVKIAKNHKGLIQNAEEVKILGNPDAQATGRFIPLIDYDRDNTPPHWVHVEKASRKATASDFEHDTGMTPDGLETYLMVARTGAPTKYLIRQPRTTTTLPQEILDISTRFGLTTGDLARPANWGWYKGRLVIIDAGLSYTNLQAIRDAD